MKKKIIVVLIIIAMGFLGFIVFGRFIPETEEDMLVYEGTGTQKTVIDIAIQEDSKILYIRKIKLIQDDPTLNDVIQIINENNEGIQIITNVNGEIEKIDDCENNHENKWGILVENKKIEETDTRLISVENYQGITILYQK